MNVNDLKGKTIAFAASGGLDSCTITHWLTHNGVKVVAFTADLAQPDETDFSSIGKRMRACGAVDFVAVPLQKQMAAAGIEGIQAPDCCRKLKNAASRFLRTARPDAATIRSGFSSSPICWSLPSAFTRRGATRLFSIVSADACK